MIHVELYGVSFTDSHLHVYRVSFTDLTHNALTLTLSSAPQALGSFTRTPQDLTIPEGSIAFFECSADNATPTPTYTWYNGEDPVIPDGTRVYISNVTHTLLMRDVGAEEEGSYHCRVENSAGSMDSPPATLTLRPLQEFAGTAHVRNIVCTVFEFSCTYNYAT